MIRVTTDRRNAPGCLAVLRGYSSVSGDDDNGATPSGHGFVNHNEHLPHFEIRLESYLQYTQ